MAWCWFVTRSHYLQVIPPWQSLVIFKQTRKLEYRTTCMGWLMVLWAKINEACVRRVTVTRLVWRSNAGVVILVLHFFPASRKSIRPRLDHPNNENPRTSWYKGSNLDNSNMFVSSQVSGETGIGCDQGPVSYLLDICNAQWAVKRGVRTRLRLSLQFPICFRGFSAAITILRMFLMKKCLYLSCASFRAKC